MHVKYVFLHRSYSAPVRVCDMSNSVFVVARAAMRFCVVSFAVGVRVMVRWLVRAVAGAIDLRAVAVRVVE